MAEDFDFEATRRRFPEHWDDDGRPAIGSMWRARLYPEMRVAVVGRDLDRDVRALVYWDGDLDGLRLLFTDEPTARWNIAKDRAVYGSTGIDQDRRWRDNTDDLVVTFDRAKFGGPDTWHMGLEDVNLPFFEPIARQETAG